LLEARVPEAAGAQARNLRPAVQMTLGPLISNLKAFMALLERKDLGDSAGLLRCVAPAGTRHHVNDELSGSIACD
jgi:hypothetical protein